MRFVNKNLKDAVNSSYLLDGPNCWNATKCYFESDAAVEMTEPEDMDAWLSANTVEISELDLKPNDILVMRTSWTSDETGEDYDGGLVHTAVLVSKGRTKKMFHKKGVRGPYETVTLKQVLKIYNYYDARATWRRYIGPKTKTKAA